MTRTHPERPTKEAGLGGIPDGSLPAEQANIYGIYRENHCFVLSNPTSCYFRTLSLKAPTQYFTLVHLNKMVAKCRKFSPAFV